jgi:hypothetical protein
MGDHYQLHSWLSSICGLERLKDSENPREFRCFCGLRKRTNRDQADAKRITTQTRQAVMERGRDENLEKGARYKRQPSQPSAFARVFVRFCSMTSSIAAAHGAKY